MVKGTSVLATLVAFAALAAGPTVAGGAEGGRPVVLLLRSGGFFFEAGPMPYPERVAERLGFRPKFVPYPNGDLPAAVRAVRQAARRARANGHAVYAYGESAGGALAGVLAQDRLIAGAATYCPIADLVKFIRKADDPAFYQAMIQASDRDLRHYSPARHDSRRPILAMRAVNDSGFFNRWIASWDRRDADVVSVPVAGRHLESPRHPSVYRRNVRHGLRWMARVAGLDSPRAEPKTALHFLK